MSHRQANRGLMSPLFPQFHSSDWLSLGTGTGVGSERIFGPRMFRISAAQVLAHLVIGRRPEALQVRGDLHGAGIGAKKMQHDRDASSRQARSPRPAEQLLQPDGEDRRPVRLIEQADVPATGNLERWRGTLSELAPLGSVVKAFEIGNLVGLANLLYAGPALTELSHQSREVTLPDLWPVELGNGLLHERMPRQPGRGGRIVPEKRAGPLPQRDGQSGGGLGGIHCLAGVFSNQEILVPEPGHADDALASRVKIRLP